MGGNAADPPDTAKPSYSVILKQPPKGLKKPDSRKEYLEALAGGCCNHIVNLSPLGKEWYVIIDGKDAAKSLAEALNSATDTNARLKIPAHWYYKTQSR